MELRFAQVENITLKVTRVAVFKGPLDQLTGGKLFAGVLPRPVARDELPQKVIFTGFEAFKPRGFVQVDLEGDTVKVELAFAAGKIDTPVSRVPHIGDVTTHDGVANLVRARADRYFGDDFVEGLGRCAGHLAPGSAEHRHAAHHQRQLRVGC